MTAIDNHAQQNDSLRTDSDSKFDLVSWRRSQVLSFRARGYTIDQIVETLRAGHADIKISHGTVVNDLKWIKEQSNKQLQSYIEEELPYENKLCLAGLDEIIKESWKIATTTADDKTKISALGLAKEAYLTRQAVLGDTKIIDQAVQIITRGKAELQEMVEEPAGVNPAESISDVVNFAGRTPAKEEG